MDYIEYYKKWEPRVRKYYLKYRIFYDANSIEYKDLKQDILLNVWKAGNKYKDKTTVELGKILNSTVRNRILALARGCKKLCPEESIDENINAESETKNYTFLRHLSIEKLHEKGFDIPVEQNPKCLIDTVRPFCTEEELTILDYMFILGYSQTETALLMNMSISCLNTRYSRLMNKLRRKINKN